MENKMLNKQFNKWKYRLLASGLLAGSVLQSYAQHDPTQPFQGKLGKTLAETQQSWQEHYAKAPQGAPNVVWILLDDVGYGAISTFGGLINTPTLDSLANNGLRYTNFHTTAICSPTRAALQTGRNSHSVHMGLFPTTAIGTPGYDGYMPFEKATVAEILRENGYNTFAVGKWHLTPAADATPAGPFTRWPTGRGYEHYYGFLGGATDQYHPQVWDDTRKVDIEPNKKHFNTLIADKAISYIAEQKTVAPDKPFFLYYAPGAGHAPHQVDKVWSDKYKGKFDKGWDAYREEVLANQIKLGVVPKETVLPERNPTLKAWNSLSENERKLYSRFMEVYAGFLTQTDYEISRVINHIRDLGQLENTLIIVSVGDNGASKEGTFVGQINNVDLGWTEEQRLQKNIEQIDLIGTEKSRPNYPLGWAQAANTPFKYWKQDANAEGGTHNPLIIFYPKVVKDKGGIRNQYSHLIDILPTTIDLTGVKIPTIINGYPQEPIEGTSLAYSLDNPNALARHTVQHYEIMGSRSIYKDGWKAGTLHKKGEDFSKDVWELYNVKEDVNERSDLAAKNPEKLKELQELFDAQAWKYNVYPLKDEFTPSIVPITYVEKNNKFILYPGTSQVFDGLAPRLINRSFSITADVNIAKTAEGVLLSTGGWSAGVSFYVQNNALQFVFNNGIDKFYISSKKAIPTGKSELKFEFKYDGGQPGSGGTGYLYINNEKVGEGRIDKTNRAATGNYESIEVGRDIVSPVTEKYKIPFVFTGKINKVTIQLGEINIVSR
jgi:arylsulfatase A-like enzyme